MIIKTSDGTYKRVKVDAFGDKVRLVLGAGYEYACHMTPAEAKRIAYALLLAADGIDP